MTPHPGHRRPAVSAGSSRRLAELWMPVAGVLLAVGGTVLLARGPGAADISWFSYTPLPQEGLPGGIMLVSRSMLAGALMMLAGALLLAFWGGLQVGRRPSSRSGGTEGLSRGTAGLSGGTAGRDRPSEPPAGPGASED